MGLSFRRSLSAGPFRLNFSQRGISYSVGVRGARLNLGSNGTYVNLSAHGINYRKKLSLNRNRAIPDPSHDPVSFPQIPGQNGAITSSAIEQLTDTGSEEFIQELSKKAIKTSYTKWFGILPLIIFVLVMAFTSFGYKSVISLAATDSMLVKITSPDGVNIRKAPNAYAKILKAALNGQTYQLADTTKKKWFKVNFSDTIGYINKNFASSYPVHHDQVITEEPILINKYAPYEFFAGTVLFTILIVRLQKIDKRRFEMSLHYDMDDQFKKIYDEFGRHFKDFSSSARIWQYIHSQQTNDFKHNAGAGKLIKRIPVSLIAYHKAPLPYFTTNVAIPYIKLNSLEFYFLPERLLIKRSNNFAAVFYKNLQISGTVTRFIEDTSVPHDARVVDKTWQFVNKSGGPDRRFNNNRQLPICAYSEYTLRSETGLYEVITTSKQGAMDGFSGFLQEIGKLQSRMAAS